MSMQKAGKRAVDSASSGQPSELKRPRFDSVNKATDASEVILTPKTCLTLEGFWKRVSEEQDRAIGRLESSILNDFKENWKCRMEGLEKQLVQVKEALDRALVHSTYHGRAHASSSEVSGARNLQLRFATKLSPPLYTGKKLEGENNDAIYVHLIDANTGNVVSSGPESNIKLDVCLLEGDFNKDDNYNWTQEEFENHVVKKREGRKRILLGDRQVVLKEGVGVLGKLTITDNSSWNRSRSFRIGLKVASGYCEDVRILEAVTEAFPVKEHRGESCGKKHPPASDDEVWRLEKIAKNGKSYQRLNDAGIYKVEDFLLQLFKDSEKLRKILGMTEKNWNTLVEHANTCIPSGKLYVYYQDDTRNCGVVLENTGQLSGLIVNGAFVASRVLSTSQKGHADSMMKKALDNWSRVEESHMEAFLESNQDKHSSAITAEVTGAERENLNPVEHNSRANAVGGEAPLPPVQSGSEGHNGTTAVGLPVQSPPSLNALSVDSAFDGLRMDDFSGPNFCVSLETNFGTSFIGGMQNAGDDFNLGDWNRVKLDFGLK